MSGAIMTLKLAKYWIMDFSGFYLNFSDFLNCSFSIYTETKPILECIFVATIAQRSVFRFHSLSEIQTKQFASFFPPIPRYLDVHFIKKFRPTHTHTHWQPPLIIFYSSWTAFVATESAQNKNSFFSWCSTIDWKGRSTLHWLPPRAHLALPLNRASRMPVNAPL